MRILYIVPYVPNLIRVRPYNLIRALQQNGDQVSLATLWSSEAEYQDAARMGGICEQVYPSRLPTWRMMFNALTMLPSKVPLQANYCWQPDLDRKIQEAVFSTNGREPFDVIHVEHLRGARYGLSLKAAMRKNNKTIPVVWDSVDCISYLFEQAVRRGGNRLRKAILQLDLSRTRRYEGDLVSRFERVFVTSQVDREKLLALTSDPKAAANIQVIQNGVDLDYFQPDPAVMRDPNSLVISGKMSYHANIAMVLFLVKEIMPLVWRQRPEVVVRIVGKDPSNEIQALAHDPRIVVTGTVSDIRPYLQQAALAVAPLAYGTGIQNKVLEALACAAPLITSPQAVSALNVKVGLDLEVADDANMFAEKILNLLDDEGLRRRLGQAGRAYVERCHRWSEIAGQLAGQYMQAIDQKSIKK